MGLGAAQTLLEIRAGTFGATFPRRFSDQIAWGHSEKGRRCAIDECEAQLCIEADISLRDCVQHNGWGIHDYLPIPVHKVHVYPFRAR